jgi:predicted nucleic acid-binding protein
MILAETTIVVDFLRAPTPRLLQIIHDHQAAICGVTRAEIYCGARAPIDLIRFDAALRVCSLRLPFPPISGRGSVPTSPPWRRAAL